MKARYPGKCAGGGDRVTPGDEVVKDKYGWSHPAHVKADIGRDLHRNTHGPAPSFAWTPRPTYDEFDASDHFEAAEARRDRDRANAEYAAGVEDARRYRETRDLFGESYAVAEEYARDLRGLNGDW